MVFVSELCHASHFCPIFFLWWSDEEASEACSSLTFVLGSFVTFELLLFSWGNFGLPATPGKVHQSSVFLPCVDSGSRLKHLTVTNIQKTENQEGRNEKQHNLSNTLITLTLTHTHLNTHCSFGIRAHSWVLLCQGFQVFPFDVSLCFSSLLGGFLLFWVMFHDHPTTNIPSIHTITHIHTDKHVHSHTQQLLSPHTPAPAPNTHFTSSIPYGTNDAMLCICLIFWGIPLPLDSLGQVL